MLERKINLEEILDKVRCIDRNPDNGQYYDDDLAKVAMLEFGKQLLELAAENANLIEFWENSNSEYIEESVSIFDDDGDLQNIIYVNKQSILDTIKQVE